MSLLRSLRREGAMLAARLNRLGDGLSKGRTHAGQFIRKAHELLIGAHTKAAKLGRQHAGDLRTQHPRDERIGRQRAEQQLRHMQGFKEDLQRGRYKPKDQGGEFQGKDTGARAKSRRFLMYGEALLGTANEAWLETKQDRGETQARWVLGVADHCRTCIEEAEKGWRPLSDFDRFPGDGSTLCKTNCKCHLETSDGDESFVFPGTVRVEEIRKTPLAVEIRRIGSSAVSRDHERGFLLTPDGKRVEWVTPEGKRLKWLRGQGTQLIIPRELAPQLRGRVFVHNHLYGRSFSDSDVYAACHLGPAEIWVVSRRYRYVMKPPMEGWSPQLWSDRIAPLFYTIYEEVKRRLRQEIVEGHLTEEDADLQLLHEVWTVVAKETGLYYVRDDRKTK